MLLEQLVRFHVQSQALVWREVLSWPLAVASMWDDVFMDDERPTDNVTPIARRRDVARAA